MLYLRNVAAVKPMEFTPEVSAVLAGSPGLSLISDLSCHNSGVCHDRILNALGDLDCRDWEWNILEITVEGFVLLLLLLLHKLNVSVTVNSDEVHYSVSIFEPVARDRGP